MNVTQNFQYSDFVDFKRKQNDSLFYPCDNYDIIECNNQIVIQSKLLPYCSFSHSRPRLACLVAGRRRCVSKHRHDIDCDHDH